MEAKEESKGNACEYERKNKIDFLELKYVMLYIYLAGLAIYCV